jgi:hypothetical protein
MGANEAFWAGSEWTARGTLDAPRGDATGVVVMPRARSIDAMPAAALGVE